MNCPDLRSSALARLAAAAALFVLPAAAHAGALGVDYDISLAGIPIGVASMNAQIDRDRYKLDVRARMTGLAGVLTSGKGGASATGVLLGARPVPSTFAVVSSNSDNSRTLRMGFAAGNVRDIEIRPPLEDWDKPDRVPLNEGHKKSIIDPLSALLIPVVGAAGEAAACNRSIPLFDGATRFNIVLSYAGTRTVATASYRGPVAVCSVRYVPIAGHRSQRSVTKFMENNRDMEAWLAPVAGTNVFVPYRISVKTMVGTTVIEASRFNVDGATTASTTGRPGRTGN